MAGQSKRRRERFFTEHSRCCFCGGEAPAIEEDHQPGRVFFRSRAWPEGFVFPSCRPCNAVSRDAENYASVIISDTNTPEELAAWERRLASLQANRPDLVPDVHITANGKRRALRQMGVRPPPGVPVRDIPLARINPDVWQPELEIVGRKLMLALHYQTFGKPLSRDGRMLVITRTNGHNLQEEWLQNVRKFARSMVVPVRATRPLGDQFTLQYAAYPDPATAMYVAVLQRTVVFVGVTSEHQPTVAHMSDDLDGYVGSPFSW